MTNEKAVEIAIHSFMVATLMYAGLEREQLEPQVRDIARLVHEKAYAEERVWVAMDLIESWLERWLKARSAVD